MLIWYLFSMNQRRAFLKNTTLAALGAPLLAFDSPNTWSLAPLKRHFDDTEAYWRMVRKQFLLKEGQTYFNNGTMGPTPGYVLDKMM